MAETIIRKCVCKHPYQDKTYGEGNRVMNVRYGKEKGVRCSVCAVTYSD